MLVKIMLVATSLETKFTVFMCIFYFWQIFMKFRTNLRCTLYTSYRIGVSDVTDCETYMQQAWPEIKT